MNIETGQKIVSGNLRSILCLARARDSCEGRQPKWRRVSSWPIQGKGEGQNEFWVGFPNFQRLAKVPEENGDDFNLRPCPGGHGWTLAFRGGMILCLGFSSRCAH